MDFFKPEIEGLIVITPKIFKDERGYFFESYNKKVFEDAGIVSNFVQDNQSFSVKNVIRGLHFQAPPHAQAKLVRAQRGKVWDVAVDLRPQSKTFGQWFGVELSEENQKMFYIPRGFAHGFSVLSESAVFQYKCDNFYNKESEGGILYNDAVLNIDWKVPFGGEIVNEKDKSYPWFEVYKKQPFFN
ncbi:DTDP-4-dehydrorhamnose 3,5-epimerase [Elusimicrobium minutum Pei191]|uniref:dTDP-4-dehydrorhamnose 3,5-epimerase n=1 Tax=Elusimicrobium minutum (strain Pei191) TaxID=445932 RepID=B2KD23_ELUMP|nr:dTDP-4-dehydrorhamnose 3,5-epimerase [Elusimicrobium minutum]ACC98419.1 DTDP-4-dehydrorhamnose 3,5-epimerase [Elusimicrobium minutum Pei191]